MATWMVMAADGAASIVNPACVQLFALDMGQIATTDPIDARISCGFATHTHPDPSENNRMDTASEPGLRRLIKQHLKRLDKQLEKIEGKIAADKTMKESLPVYGCHERQRAQSGHVQALPTPI